ncbi:helix-turn-helix transcriptional regulator [Microbacterium sp. NPDC060132]|uniref:helix-turn-helix transcriptional regulator n=1 Tax=unclassified Microbacterium TaxID=2609290 RepID=UPI00364FF9F2
MITSEKRFPIRADRLIQALLLLQGRPRITAAELAAELEVSVPTARRDLEALAMAGVPLYPSRGRGGGWRLIGGARTDLTGLTESEVTSLLVALSQSRAAAPEHTAAVRKLMRAVPEPFREGAQRVAESTVRDAPWGEPDDAPERPAVSELQRAIAARRRVRFGYGDAGRPVEVVPLVVGSRGPRWYLLAAPGRNGGADVDRLRTYRVDRIADLALTDERGEGPDGFDAPAAWERMVETVEGLRGEARAVIRAEAWAVRAVLDRFGRQAAVMDADEGLIEVRAHRADALAEQLAGWTGAVEVLEPVEVRAALRELGQRIAEQYRDP